MKKGKKAKKSLFLLEVRFCIQLSVNFGLFDKLARDLQLAFKHFTVSLITHDMYEYGILKRHNFKKNGKKF